MKKLFVASIAVCLYQASAFATPPPVSAECKNLAIMQTQLLSTVFYDSQLTGTPNNPPQLTLKTNAGVSITNIQYLGGDSEDTSIKNPCDLDKTLCTVNADAGGANDWFRLLLTSNSGPAFTKEVVVSMGSRGGCVVNSAADSIPNTDN